MKYLEYFETVKYLKPSDSLCYDKAVFWVHREVLPLKLIAVEDKELEIIRIPQDTKNEFDRIVPVVAIGSLAFRGNRKVTDIILPSGIGSFPPKAFAGCDHLKNISIPKNVRTIREGTFAGCVSLENVYYEGTMEEWREINIVHEKHEIEFGSLISGTPEQSIKAERLVPIPGNEALLNATIHFGCDFGFADNLVYGIKSRGRDVTDLFRTP